MKETKQVIMCIDMDGCIAEYAAVALDDFYEDGYFLNLLPHQELLNFLKILNGDIEIYIVSACITEKSRGEKAKWLDKYFPEIPKDHRIFTECGVSKSAYMEDVLGRKIDKNCILLDDHSPNLIDWEKHGGTAIKVNNGKNCKGKKWKGLTMSLSRPNVPAFREE